MCVLLTVTLMTYCMKKASSGSCAMEVCILSFMVLVPFMIALAILYFAAPLLNSGATKSLSAMEPKCEKSRALGIVERIYPDGNQVKFRCTALNFGDNLAISLSECFPRGEPVSNKHFITSRSPYWNKDNTIHDISSFKTITEDGKTITLMEASPSLPEPCSANEEQLSSEDSYFFVEQSFQPDTDHILLGWEYDSLKAFVPYQEIPVSTKCIPSYPSAMVFARNGRYFTGFQTGECFDTDDFKDSLIQYSMFLKHVHELYPNIEYKNAEPGKKVNSHIFDSQYKVTAVPKTPNFAVSSFNSTTLTAEIDKLIAEATNEYIKSIDKKNGDTNSKNNKGHVDNSDTIKKDKISLDKNTQIRRSFEKDKNLNLSRQKKVSNRRSPEAHAVCL